MVALLVSTLAVVGTGMLMRKRFDSNIPLLFYFFAIGYTNMFERPVHPAILYGSLAFALLLRFEFMGATFTKFIAFMAGVGLCLTMYSLMIETMV